MFGEEKEALEVKRGLQYQFTWPDGFAAGKNKHDV